MIKTGSGKELRHFHDVLSRHVGSLRNIKGDTFGAYLSVSMEMKLDQESKFAWQKYTYDKRDVPSIDELLELVDWRAQASEFSISRDVDRRSSPIEGKLRPKHLTRSQRNVSVWVAMKIAIHYTPVAPFRLLHLRNVWRKQGRIAYARIVYVKGTSLATANLHQDARSTEGSIIPCYILMRPRQNLNLYPIQKRRIVQRRPQSRR